MTTSISSAPAREPAAVPEEVRTPQAEVSRTQPALGELDRTLTSRLIFLTLCTGLIFSTLAYGTVNYWSLAVFQAGAAFILLLWVIDAWSSGALRLSTNPLQLPLVGLAVIGLVQLLPFGSAPGGDALPAAPVHTLSLDPYATRMVVIQTIALLVYFAAALAYTDSPRRLRLLVQAITIFGFALAVFGLIQHFSSPTQIYWIRDLPQSVPFGPFVNRHHFAGYMELTLCLPLGLLFSGAIAREKRVLFIFASAVMGIALIMTNSRGGVISLLAEVAFLALVTGFRRPAPVTAHGEEGDAAPDQGRVRRAATRVGLALALFSALVVGVVILGGESSLNRIVGTVSADDPTTGRAHFWSVTLNIIRDHPVLGTGLGSFGLAYTKYDTRNGRMRLEQAHNDYLQTASDAGVAGVILGLGFVVILFRRGFAARESQDRFRSAVATSALAGCFAVLVHSLFDFTLHTTSNALLFLTLAAMATIDSRVERTAGAGHHSHHARRHRRRSRERERTDGAPEAEPAPDAAESAVESAG